MMAASQSLQPQMLTDTEKKLFQDHPELTLPSGRFDIKRSQALFYKPEIIEKIIAARQTGLSPCQAFKKAGLDKKTFYEWKAKLEDEKCAAPIKYLFGNIILDPSDDR